MSLLPSRPRAPWSIHGAGALAVGLLLLAPPARAQCPPVSTYVGFHQENVGSALAAEGDEALFGHFSGFTFGVFRRGADDMWSRTQLLGSGLAPRAFGLAVDLRGDTAVAGDPFDSTLGPDHGAIAIFERSGGALARVMTFLPPSPASSLQYGFAVAVSDDESLVLAGAPRENGTGVAYVYARTTSGWVPDGVLTPAGLGPNDSFGSSLAAFGGQLFVGAPGHAGKGAVIVFERQGGVWTEVDRIVPSAVAAGDFFGASLRGAGDLLFVGATGHDPNGVQNAGAVFRLRRGAGGWANPWRIAAVPRRPGSQFGRSLDHDGARLAVGAVGYAYVFESLGGPWVEIAEHTYPDAVTFSDFGAAVALYSQGLLVGAPQYDDNGFNYPDNMGGVHAYDLTDAGLPLVACGHTISRATGGSERLLLQEPSAAGRTYLVAGSVSGTGPFLVNGVAVPLTPDGYTQLTLAQPGMAPLPGGFGVLDANGEAQADFVLPAGLPPVLVGLTFLHAFVTFDPTGAVASASNPVAVTLIP